MSKNRLSPLTSVAMSLSVALGILVADLTSTQSLLTAQAQTRGGAAPLAYGRVVGQRIVATNVLVNGVVTNGVFLDSVAVADSVVSGLDPSSIVGAFPHEPESAGGAFPHEPDPLTAGGAFPHEPDPWTAGGAFPHEPESAGGAFPHEPESASSLAGGVELTGGVVTGEDVTVKDGVITGRNLVVEGTVVSRTFSPVQTLD